MSDGVLFGFERSTYVYVARLALVAKGGAFEFSDTESAMQAAGGRTLHQFGQVPVLRHKDSLLWETAAIVTYVDEAFDGPPLQPASPDGRAAMRAWMGSVDAYSSGSCSTWCTSGLSSANWASRLTSGWSPARCPRSGALSMSSNSIWAPVAPGWRTGG